MTLIAHIPIRLFRLVKGEKKEAGRNVTVYLIQNRNFTTLIQLINQPGDELLLSAEISEVFNIQYKMNELIVFFDINYRNKLYNFSFLFQKQNQLQTFINEYIRCLFEYREQRRTTTSDKPELDRFINYIHLDLPKKSIRNEFVFPEEEYETIGSPDNGRNILLRTGKSTGNTMVLRKYHNHCDLGLFTLDNNCSFRMALPKIVDENKQLVIGSDMLNINHDRSLLILDDDNPTEIHDMNLDRGIILTHYDSVDQYGVDQKLKKLLPTRSNGHDSTFLAFTDRDTIMFDPRSSKSLINKSEYKTKNGFTSGATSRNGYVAIGSKDGIVRLYSQPCKTRATINFQMNVGGDPIIGLDISEDEQWVVATCPYYLSVFNVLSQSTGKLGFVKAMGKDKPPLTRLTIKQEHQQYIAQIFNGVLPSFSPAKFEMKNHKISSIISAIGSCIVSWNFQRIENGCLPSYSIKLVGEEIIADNEPFENTHDILFITDNQVSVIERKMKNSSKYDDDY
ncbi:hypothetical protein TRFO_35036 [Tritrichomonas foetus]|uniref:Vacuolar import/degradation Vid27 C-terminal domain-containing protein n=1 Tax=Tritrichomonas foetus TaxID=1144522 RepID=A0A1J4JMN8_9EUKA|nr:hypothetical protein TRFO_35036 [Tritrichomonas foetus]|eukprot:OHS98508.1 hypothetical protein TRFO_35036 [Tritrichomonas foetus]